MKAKIIKPDGTIIELEGNEVEINKVLEGFKAAPVQYIPYQQPVWIYPNLPYSPWITYTYPQTQIDLTPKITCNQPYINTNATGTAEVGTLYNWTIQKVSN